MYAHGMSFTIEEHAALPGVPLVLALGYDAFLKRRWRGAQVGLGIVAMLCVTLPATQRFTRVYSWWGWEEKTIYKDQGPFEEPSLQGFTAEAYTRDTIESILTLIRERVPPGGAVYTFPHLPLFNMLTGTYQPTFSPVHYFDVCPDLIAKSDAERLLVAEPNVVVWFEMPEDVWIFHEKVFREGKRSGQRAIAEVVHGWLATGRYRVIKSYISPAYKWELQVLEKNTKHPIHDN